MPPQEGLQHRQGVLVQSPVGSLLLSSGSWCVWSFVCALPDWSLCFPQPSRKPIIKSCWPSSPDSLGIPTPFVRSPGWEAWYGVQNLTTARKLLWYYCFPVCGSPTWWLWDLILSWSHPPTVSLRLLLCLWTQGIFSWWVPVFSCQWFSTASCNLVLSQEEMSALLLFRHLEQEAI